MSGKNGKGKQRLSTNLYLSLGALPETVDQQLTQVAFLAMAKAAQYHQVKTGNRFDFQLAIIGVPFTGLFSEQVAYIAQYATVKKPLFSDKWSSAEEFGFTLCFRHNSQFAADDEIWAEVIDAGVDAIIEWRLRNKKVA